MTEEQIIEDQDSHHEALIALTKAYDLITELNDKDHHIERKIVQIINLIKDKDQRMVG